MSPLKVSKVSSKIERPGGPPRPVAKHRGYGRALVSEEPSAGDGFPTTRSCTVLVVAWVLLRVVPPLPFQSPSPSTWGLRLGRTGPTDVPGPSALEGSAVQDGALQRRGPALFDVRPPQPAVSPFRKFDRRSDAPPAESVCDTSLGSKSGENRAAVDAADTRACIPEMFRRPGPFEAGVTNGLRQRLY